ncbi:alkaline phosphatase D family protein [Aureimonas mangrovi]|uniref:alkaline phosphatase D family protein n=1 Tax=Aureimonas mangrovi TaxID=2758041 RepID=UPI001FEAA657|nr:alkaline phosphatase D family protein [Aureimonas mangrovi]
MKDTENTASSFAAGPILYARGSDGERCVLTALVVTTQGREVPALLPDGGEPIEPRHAAALFGHDAWLYDFALPVGTDAGYSLAGERHPVVTDLTGDTRFAFVSCNGQENGDEDRDPEHRDVMWRRLRDEHQASPFSLLIHGGDQLYADEAVEVHPDSRRWSEAADDDRPKVPASEEMREALRRYFFFRYLAQMRQPAAAVLYAQVPSMMIWDDHDICDGWGSHPAPFQNSPVGQALFAAAREAFLLFQMGATADELPAIVGDRSGRSLASAAFFPGFGIALPDLRSERTPERVMGDTGWQAFENALDAMPDGARRFVISSVPTLGPRLSLVESLLDFYPKKQKYEDDLRDQWQSRGHRGEWRRWLAALERQSTEHGAAITVISGEIHLAARATMRFSNGEMLHQLVASGITHPEPPQAFAMGLALLSTLGDSPLEGRPIRIRALPGQRWRYTAERNYLVVERRGALWTAAWELERSGRTPALAI